MTVCDIQLDAIAAFVKANWAYAVAAASAFISITPTPDPSTTAGKLYKVLELVALNFSRAKETGVPAEPAKASPTTPQ